MASYEEIGGEMNDGNAVVGANAGKISELAYSRSRAATIAEKYLSKRLRRVLRFWRKETDTYLQNTRFKLRLAYKEVHKEKVKRICALMVANERAMTRHVFHAFMHWRMETEVEKRALDRR